MGTFRVYGDSFGTDMGLEWQYVNRLQQYLDMPQENFSIFGCANEWIIKNLLYDLVYDNIKPDDFVLVVTTSETRHWLFKNIPDVSNFNGIADLYTALNSREIAALKGFVAHLQNTDLDVQRYFANSALIRNLAQAVESLGARCLVIPGFTNPVMSDLRARWLESYIYHNPSVVGSLNNDVCFKEFDSLDTSVKWYRTYNLPDIRANHMLKQNHDVFYDKIIDHLENGTAIDLTQGFNTGVITPQRLHQYWSYQGETVDLNDWSGNFSKMGNPQHIRIQRLLKRIRDLESSRDTLPFSRSNWH